MRGDFSRITFNTNKRYSRVLFQQGRNLLDADFNELLAIQRDQLRTLAKMATSLWGKPSPDFNITVAVTTPAGAKPSLDIQVQGSYYLGEVLANFSKMPKRTVDRPATGDYLVLYLEVYEETVFPQSERGLLEPALDPRDTALRQKPVSVLQVMKTTSKPPVWGTQQDFCDYLGNAGHPGKGQLKARVKLQTDPQTSRCDPLAADQYLGVENQLYRVEIHTAAGTDPKNPTPATFKWSRDNASVVFPVKDYASDGQSIKVTLAKPMLDETWALQRGNWVELVRALPTDPVWDSDPYLNPNPLPLFKVTDVDSSSVTLARPVDFLEKNLPGELYPLLVRWDQTASANSTGGVPVDLKTDVWLPLEAGVQVQFVGNDQSVLRPGDYWLIPARAASQDVLWWPRNDKKEPLERKPDGPEHLYAPLAYLDGSETDDGPLSVHSYPWDKDPTPVTDANWKVNRLVINAASPYKDDDPPYTPGEDIGLKVLDDLKDPSAPIVITYSLRQMLVIAGSDPVIDPPPKWADLLESLRRFQLEHRVPLVKLIHDRVDPLLVSNKVKDILKLPSSEAKIPAFIVGKLVPDDIKGLTIVDPIKTSLATLGLTTVPALVKIRSAVALIAKVADLGTTLTDQQKKLLTDLWQAAARVDHYFKAWPYRTVDPKDWP